MSRLPIGRISPGRRAAALLLGAFFAFAFAGCGNRQNSASQRSAESSSLKPEISAPIAYHPAPDAKPVDPATAATVSGVVKLDGPPPKMRSINMRSVPSCQQMHADSPAVFEDVVPGENGTLQNVVVYLSGDFNAYRFPPARQAVTIDQKGCMYVPHVVALQTGAPLRIHNSDSSSHNSNTLTRYNSPWNETQPVGGAPVEHFFSQPEIGLALKCNIHPWMKAYVSVFSHPYFQVTGADGSFALKNVPPGDYQLQAWHERYGLVQQPIRVTAKSEQSVTITFKAG